MKKRSVFLLLLALALFAGCSASGEAPAEKNADAEPAQMATMQCLYPLPTDVSVSGIAAVEDTCLVVGEAESELYIAVMPFSVDGNAVSFSDSISFKYEGKNHVYGIAAGEKNFYLLVGNREEDQYTEDAAQLAILTICFSGELVEAMPLSDSFSVEPRGFCSSGDRFIIGGNNFLKFFNRDGELESVVKTDYEIWAFQPSGSGAVVQLNKNSHFPLFFVDGTEKLTPIEWDDEWLSFSRQDYNGKLIYGEDVFYAYDPDTGKKRELFSWLELTGDIYRYNNFCRIAEDCYLYSGSGSAVFLMTTEYKVDSRTPIQIAFLGDNSQSNAQRMAAKFNLYSTEYRAEAAMYEKQQLELAIAAGECPDVVFFSGDNLDTTTNQFLNLMPMLEQSDVLSEDSLLPGLVDSLTIGNELHELWYSLAVYYWCGQTNYIDLYTDKSWEDYCTRAAELGDSYTVVNQELNKNIMLDDFLRSEIHNYVDLNHWTCTFDSPSFAELLRLCKETGIDYSPIYDSDDRGMEYEAYMANYVERLPLIRYSIIPSCYAEFQDETSLIRSPFSDIYASYDETPMGSKLCVPVRSANVDGAFTFIEYVLRSETQIQNYFEANYLYGIPTNMEALEYCFENIMKPEDARQLRTLIDTEPQVINAVKQHLIEMIKESAQAYFGGDKSLGETASLIQSRASIYLAEKSPLK